MKKRTSIGLAGFINLNMEAKFGGAVERQEKINQVVSFKNMSARKTKMKTKDSAIKRSKNKNLINLFAVFAARKSVTILMNVIVTLILKQRKLISNKNTPELISLETSVNCLLILKL